MMGARGWDDQVKRNETGLNRQRASRLSRIFSENRYVLFAGAARRVRIML
jgi:hypothetical protein